LFSLQKRRYGEASGLDLRRLRQRVVVGEAGDDLVLPQRESPELYVRRGRHIARVDRVELLDVRDDTGELDGETVDLDLGERQGRELRHVQDDLAIDLGSGHGSASQRSTGARGRLRERLVAGAITGDEGPTLSPVFVSCPLPGDAIDELRREHVVVVGREHVGVRGEAFAEGAPTFQAIISVVTDRIDAALLARTPRLRIVANVAVGYDNIDVASCISRGVAVTNTPGVLTEATADLAFGLLLAAGRRIAEGDRLVRREAFAGWTPSLLLGPCVHGATLGLVGLGRIGQAVARRARGFGMRVLYAARTGASRDVERAVGATHVSLDDLFEHSDFVSLHCPLTPETRHLVNARRLARMKSGAVLVNTARGACVDEAALAIALRDGPLAAAGLDVFEDEPRVHPALLALDNVVLAPHIGSADRPTRVAMAAMAIDSVRAVLAGRLPIHPVAR
jgi:glyoxylate reductase